MTSKATTAVKRGAEALTVLEAMLKGGRIDSVERRGTELVISLQSGVEFVLEPWGEGTLPVQVNIGSDTKPYYQGTLNKADGITLFERGTVDG